MFVRLPPVPGVEEVLFDLGESGPEVVVLGVILCPDVVLTRLDPDYVPVPAQSPV